MTIFNFDLGDGEPPISFSLKTNDAERFTAFMHQYNTQNSAIQQAITASTQKSKELIRAIRSVNRSKNQEVPREQHHDDAPRYWQRKEWVDWVLSIADEAEQEVTNTDQQLENLNKELINMD